jgi:hypothetical protein
VFVIIGSWFDAQSVLAMAEGQVVCVFEGPVSLNCIAGLFAIYFVMNMEYDRETSATMEFIQRSVFIIFHLWLLILCTD